MVIDAPPRSMKPGLARVIRHEPPNSRPARHVASTPISGHVGITGAPGVTGPAGTPPDGAHFPVEMLETGKILWLLPLLENVTWRRTTLLDRLVYGV